MKEEDKIKNLIDKIIAGKASKEEEECVNDYFSKDGSYSEWDNSVMGNKNEVKQDLRIRIEGKIRHKKETNPILRQLLPISKVAASLLFICLLGWYMVEKDPPEADYKKAQNETIVPGRERGSLILSNGSEINLETIAIGEQINHSNVFVSKNKAGEIEYSFLNLEKGAQAAKIHQDLNVLTTPLGGRFTIVLADGSKVWLNSGSKLIFPNQFSESKREVSIVGEAYFQIAKNEKQPFIVHTNKTQIQVLGTEFNVNAYVNEPENITTLIEGNIQLKVGDAIQPVLPGQQVVMKEGESSMLVTEADIETITAWKHNNFVFKNQNIRTIMKEISRWYNVEVEYEGNMENKFFDVFVSRRKDIREILSMIELTESVHFIIEGRRVRVIE